MADEHASYRELIDALVAACEGQGQVGAQKAAAGVWKRNADETALDIPERRTMNDVLLRLSAEDRHVLGQALADEFESGVHETLEVLYEHGVDPFTRCYEGTPFRDFIGRRYGWEWPDEEP